MPVDPALVAETRDWLIKANEDLQASELLSKGALPALAAFHAQQAAEKALKAFLTWHDHDFLKTHDLDILGDDCVAIDSTLATVSSAVSPISRYAVERGIRAYGPTQLRRMRARHSSLRGLCTTR
jgi:hypothetical protein